MKIKSKIEIERIIAKDPQGIVGLPLKYRGLIIGKCISATFTKGDRCAVIEYEITDKQIIDKISSGKIISIEKIIADEDTINCDLGLHDFVVINYDKPFKQARIKIVLSLAYDFMQVPYVMSMMNLKKSGFTSFDISRGPQIIAMNLAMKDFEDYDAILLTEWDHDFKPDALETLWNMNVPVASAIFKSRKGDHNWLLIDETTDEDKRYVNPPSMTDPFSIDCTGLGFMLIRREVLEKIGRPIFKPFSKLYHNIDRELCRDIKKAGFEVTINPNVRLGHYCTKRVY